MRPRALSGCDQKSRMRSSRFHCGRCTELSRVWRRVQVDGSPSGGRPPLRSRFSSLQRASRSPSGLLEAAAGRPVVLPPLQPLGQAVHAGDRVGRVVGVLVALAVAERLHQPGGRVAQVRGDRLGDVLGGVARRAAVGGVDGVALRCRRQVHRGLGQRGVGFGHPELVRRVGGGDGQRQRLRIGEPDVFGGEADQPARHVHRVLAGLEHPRQPVERGVRIGVAQRLVQRRDDVEVLFAALVVEQGTLLEQLRDQRRVHRRHAAARRVAGDELQRVQGDARVAAGVAGDDGGAVVGERDRVRRRVQAEAALRDRSTRGAGSRRRRPRRAAAARTPSSATAAPR